MVKTKWSEDNHTAILHVGDLGKFMLWIDRLSAREQDILQEKYTHSVTCSYRYWNAETIYIKAKNMEDAKQMGLVIFRQWLEKPLADLDSLMRRE